MINGIFVLSGSNLGDRMLHLETAVQKILHHGIRIVKKSPVYRTAAWGLRDQPDFYNQALQLGRCPDPEQLLAVLLDIEKEMGRERLEKWGSRIIDLDLLYFDQQILQTRTLILPHPRIAERRFALAPMAQLSPDFIHPVLGMTQRELLRACQDPLDVSLIN